MGCRVGFKNPLNPFWIRGQFSKEITLVVFTYVIYTCKVSLVKYKDSIKIFYTLEFTCVFVSQDASVTTIFFYCSLYNH